MKGKQTITYWFEDNPKSVHPFIVRFDYDADEDEVMDVVVDTLYRFYFREWCPVRLKEEAKKQIKSMVEEYDLLDWFVQNMEDVSQHFRDKAEKEFYRE